MKNFDIQLPPDVSKRTAKLDEALGKCSDALNTMLPGNWAGIKQSRINSEVAELNNAISELCALTGGDRQGFIDSFNKWLSVRAHFWSWRDGVEIVRQRVLSDKPLPWLDKDTD